MNKLRLPVFILFCCVALCNRVVGQGTTNNQLQIVTANTVSSYHKAIGQQSHLYRGPAYEFYNIQSIGNAYFKDTLAFSNGTVKYDGVVYKDVPLLYDEYGHLLVTLLYDNYTKLSLLTDKVSEFDCQGHHFIRFVPNDLNKKMDVGFYDELYNNKLQLLVKRVKTLQEDPTTTKSEFIPKNSYYLKKGALYYSVNSQSQLLDVLVDKKKELKQYLKDNNIVFSDNKEQAMVMLATYYDHITN